MKKITAILLAGTAIAGLSACGDDTTAEDGLSAEEIINNSMEAMEDLTSYSTSMAMNQSMNVGEDDEGMAFTSSGEASITMEPMTMKQSTVMSMGESTLGEEGEIEYLSYFSEEEGFFIEDPMMGEWMKLPESFMNELLAMSEAQMSPEDQLKPFKEYLSDLSVETTDDSYVVTLESEGLDMDELISQLSSMGVEGVDPMLSEMMGDIEFESIDYVITIDKETFFQTEAAIDLILTMDMMGESLTTEQNITMTFTDFNELEPVQIPQDIIDNATEMSEEDMMMGSDF